MNIDNQLILGIVFITAGIALALLAYAALLNRREEEDAEEPEEGEMVPAEEVGEAETSAASEMEAGHSEPVAAADVTPTSPEAPTVAGAAAETIRSESPAAPTAEPTVEAAPPESAAPQEPTSAQRPEARLLRDPDNERLTIEIADKRYRSMEELRMSEDWPHVSSLFSDLLAWMVKREPTAESVEAGAPPEPAVASDSGKSMVEQINDVLAERTADREDALAGVRLMAGADGGIRVFVGLESYPMDEVPDPEVREAIRQAVAEWESRQ